MSYSEFPGFALPDTPVFNHAVAATSFAGEFPDTVAMLDLAMVFGSRLWGHDMTVPALDAPGLGDLLTHASRARACARLCERVAEEHPDITDADELRALVLHTGSEAVETAIKTATRATGRDRLVAFEGGYHGTFGLALAVTHRAEFREPWAAQYAHDVVTWGPWGVVPQLDETVACVVVEPWQGRAGVLAPPDGFLAGVRAECDRVGAVLVLDAVLCGAGRTGPTIAAELASARPDIVCLGKAIGGGFTASAAVARTALATAAWERGPVEPAHTSTSIGDPIACLGILDALDRLTDRSEELDDAAVAWRELLQPLAREHALELRGTGLLWALDTNVAGSGLELARRLLDEHDVIVVPSGIDAASITLYPAVVTTDLERERFVVALTRALT